MSDSETHKSQGRTAKMGHIKRAYRKGDTLALKHVGKEDPEAVQGLEVYVDLPWVEFGGKRGLGRSVGRVQSKKLHRDGRGQFPEPSTCCSEKRRE